METRKIVVGKVCDLNSETIVTSNPPRYIQYLDTGSITRNRIEKIQLLDSNMAPFPSRAQRKIKKGTIIYSTVRPIQEHFGFFENPEENLIVSTGFLTIDVIDKEIDPKFLYYSITRKDLTNYLQTVAVNNVSSYPSINPDDVGNLELEIPSNKIVQNRIANVLSVIDSKIELNNRINAELEKIAKTLYDYWFVQFDFPDAKGKPHKSSGGKMIWNDELKRLIPEGWGVKNLRNIENNIVTGKTPLTSNIGFYNGDVPFITIGDIRENMHVIKTEIYLSLAGADFQKSKYIPKGSLCVTCIASPGLIAFATQNSQTNQQINSIVIQNDENRTYLYYALNDYFKFAKGAKTGNTFANMNKGDFESIVLVHPPKEYLFDFEKFAKPIVNEILNRSIENQKLSELRDWLLPMLMNGQVRVG